MSSLEQTLPREYYLSEEVYQQEKDYIFFREWFCAGREEEIPNPGDYCLVEVAGENILVVRTREGQLAAHYNVCRHRGSQLVPTHASKFMAKSEGGPQGTFPGAIRCPYHSWTYGLDGRLRTAPFLEEDHCFYKEEFTLYPVGFGTWGGFFFLNLKPEEARANGYTLLSQLGAIPQRLSRYPLHELRLAKRIVYEVEANWKVLLENYNECYHCAGVHPELCKVVPAFKQRGGTDLDWDRGIPHKEGAFTFTFTGTTNRAPFQGLNEDEKIRHKGELIYPNFMLSLSADHVAAFTLWPRSFSHTTILCDFLFHPSEMAKPDFDSSDAVEFWDLTNRQDWTICEAVQRGMRSRVFQSGYYAPMESLSLDIRRYVYEHLNKTTASNQPGGAQ